jgi:hypothetical protein
MLSAWDDGPKALPALAPGRPGRAPRRAAGTGACGNGTGRAGECWARHHRDARPYGRADGRRRRRAAPGRAAGERPERRGGARSVARPLRRSRGVGAVGAGRDRSRRAQRSSRPREEAARRLLLVLRCNDLRLRSGGTGRRMLSGGSSGVWSSDARQSVTFAGRTVRLRIAEIEGNRRGNSRCHGRAHRRAHRGVGPASPTAPSMSPLTSLSSPPWP